jgi:hypothetical protein
MEEDLDLPRRLAARRRRLASGIEPVGCLSPVPLSLPRCESKNRCGGEKN